MNDKLRFTMLFVPEGRDVNNPVQVARSDTQLGDGECARENPRGEQAVKRERRMFRAERKKVVKRFFDNLNSVSALQDCLIF
jgi:hypothetical protein